MMTIRCER